MEFFVAISYRSRQDCHLQPHTTHHHPHHHHSPTHTPHPSHHHSTLRTSPRIIRWNVFAGARKSTSIPSLALRLTAAHSHVIASVQCRCALHGGEAGARAGGEGFHRHRRSRSISRFVHRARVRTGRVTFGNADGFRVRRAGEDARARRRPNKRSVLDSEPGS